MNEPHLLYPFLCWWTFRLLSLKEWTISSLSIPLFSVYGHLGCFHWLNEPHLLYPFLCWWTLWLLSLNEWTTSSLSIPLFSVDGHLGCFHWMNEPHLLYPFLCWWTLRLLSCLVYCQWCCSEHWGTCEFELQFSLDICPKAGFLDFIFSFLRNLLTSTSLLVSILHRVCTGPVFSKLPRVVTYFSNLYNWDHVTLTIY